MLKCAWPIPSAADLRRRLREVLERQADISEQTKDGTHLSTNVAQTVQQMVQLSVVATGAILVADGEFGFGAIIAATILSGKAIAPFAQLSLDGRCLSLQCATSMDTMPPARSRFLL